MSNFWNTSDGASAADNATGTYDVGGGGPLIPDGSTVLAVIDAAAWRKDDNFNEYIELTWAVVKPEAVAGSKVWHKLWVKDLDPKSKTPEKAATKRDNAKRLFANIDLNAGGKLVRAGREPTDDDMALALTNKPMAIKVKVWEQNGNSGNWVATVFPKDKPLELGTTPVAKPAPATTGGMIDDEVPF